MYSRSEKTTPKSNATAALNPLTTLVCKSVKKTGPIIKAKKTQRNSSLNVFYQSLLVFKKYSSSKYFLLFKLFWSSVNKNISPRENIDI